MRLVLQALCCLAAPAAAQDIVPFQSPSGNIMCLAAMGSENWVRCDMRELTPSYTQRPADCDLDWGNFFMIDPVGPGYLGCFGDTAIDPSAGVIPYGEYLTFGAITCYSETTGMTCQNPGGNGFELSRAQQFVY